MISDATTPPPVVPKWQEERKGKEKRKGKKRRLEVESQTLRPNMEKVMQKV